jgi:hypothetical protein
VPCRDKQPVGNKTLQDNIARGLKGEKEREKNTALEEGRVDIVVRKVREL